MCAENFLRQDPELSEIIFLTIKKIESESEYIVKYSVGFGQCSIDIIGHWTSNWTIGHISKSNWTMSILSKSNNKKNNWTIGHMSNWISNWMSKCPIGQMPNTDYE